MHNKCAWGRGRRRRKQGGGTREEGVRGSVNRGKDAAVVAGCCSSDFCPRNRGTGRIASAPSRSIRIGLTNRNDPANKTIDAQVVFRFPSPRGRRERGRIPLLRRFHQAITRLFSPERLGGENRLSLMDGSRGRVAKSRNRNERWGVEERTNPTGCWGNRWWKDPANRARAKVMFGMFISSSCSLLHDSLGAGSSATR